MRTVITGTGAYIPADVMSNRNFTTHDFYDEHQKRIAVQPEEIVRKFEMVTGIYARRYAGTVMDTSDMAAIAAQKAIEEAGIDPETIDQIILAHNFGNVSKHTIQSDAVPALASRVKKALAIKNPSCIAYDILFGCPGWIQGIIQAHAFFSAGLAKTCLVIGAETLSRVIDPYDRDSMIFSDGAGAAIIEAKPDGEAGILGAVAESHVIDEVELINMGKSNFPESDPRIRYIKMQGRKVYEFALKQVPKAMKACLDKHNIPVTDLKKIFIHQANEKMDAAIVKAFYQLYDLTVVPELVMPMNIRELGNSSVATVPTLLDMVRKGQLPDQELHSGDVILFASVGAGMNINAFAYRV